MRRPLLNLTFASLALGLSSCDTTTTYDVIATTYAGGAALADLGAKYPVKDYSERARWIAPPRHMDVVVNLGEVDDPRLHGRDLQGEGYLVNSVPDAYWYARYHVKKLYSYGALSGVPAGRVEGLPADVRPYPLFGRQVLPNFRGLYLHELKQTDECSAILTTIDRMDYDRDTHPVRGMESNPYIHLIGPYSACFKMHYIGQNISVPGAYLAYQYMDANLVKSRIGVLTAEIRSPSGEVVARGVSCLVGGTLTRLAGVHCANDGVTQMKYIEQAN